MKSPYQSRFMKKYDSRGLGHHILLPLLAIIAVGGIGAYLTSAIWAASSVSSGNTVYQTPGPSGSLLNGTIVSLTSDGRNPTAKKAQESETIHESSWGNKWILETKGSREKGFRYFALSADLKTTISYGVLSSSADIDCKTPGAKTYYRSARFMQDAADPSTPPRVVVLQSQVECDGGKRLNSRIYSVGPKGADRKELYYDSADGPIYYLNSYRPIGSNGNILFHKAQVGASVKSYILTSSGSVISTPDNSTAHALSRDGGRVVLSVIRPEGSSYELMDVATRERVRTKLMQNEGNITNHLVDVTKDAKMWLLVKTQKLSDDRYAQGIFVYDVTKDSRVALDSGLSDRAAGSFQNAYFSASGNFVGYTKYDQKYKSFSVRRIKIDGSQRLITKDLPYETPFVVMRW
ncbi:hypothetical protein KBD11_00315 [Candidatus Saccharibacteria bacterium]|nr:hypothetical protein [Candidatus Saccharibacteria bacterium]